MFCRQCNYNQTTLFNQHVEEKLIYVFGKSHIGKSFTAELMPIQMRFLSHYQTLMTKTCNLNPPPYPKLNQNAFVALSSRETGRWMQTQIMFFTEYICRRNSFLGNW